MKRTAIAVFLGLLHAASPNYNKDVESVDTIIKALYEVISGEKGEERDWDRFRNLFVEFEVGDCEKYRKGISNPNQNLGGKKSQ